MVYELFSVGAPFSAEGFQVNSPTTNNGPVMVPGNGTGPVNGSVMVPIN